MLLIVCPYCGPRSELEFRSGGEAHISRPSYGSKPSDAVWANFLFYRGNPRGVHAERWVHAQGCGRWFNALRNTSTDAFVETYTIGKKRPDQGESS